jgi:hypothetical protein
MSFAAPSRPAPSPGAGFMTAVAERNWLVPALLAGLAAVFGVLVAGSPKLAVAVVAAAAMLTLALTAPVTILVLLLALTAIVPYEVQHPLAIGATGNSPGLLFSDALLMSGLFRTILTLPHMRLERRRTIVALVVTCFVAICLVQAVRGIRQGNDFSAIGAEFRNLLGFATVVIAMPILEDKRARTRLLAWMLALGLALGLWGLAQWALHISFGAGGDIGVRQGVSLTTNGQGQLQGGLFVFPIAILLALAALISGQVRNVFTRIALIAVVILNGVALVLTFERAVWVATLAGFCFLIARAGGRARLRAVLWTPVVLALVMAGLSAVAPGAATTARQRLLSIGQYSSDPSVRYRLDESRRVIARIHAQPVAGSGLGATIHWTGSDVRARPRDSVYTHVGYLWLAWKLGIPAAVLLVSLMLAAAFWRRGPPDGEPLVSSVRAGCQAALLAALVISITFPVFNSLQASSAVGLLIAFAAFPKRRTLPQRG